MKNKKIILTKAEAFSLNQEAGEKRMSLSDKRIKVIKPLVKLEKDPPNAPAGIQITGYSYSEEDLKEAIKRILATPYNREQFLEQWKEHFEKLENRKPTKREIMCFKVGFDAGTVLIERRIDEEMGKKLT